MTVSCLWKWHIITRLLLILITEESLLWEKGRACRV